ncbi:sensor domain-containing protein [Trichlorobacter ammonificans]|uniref:Cyclic-guanylate-specific phosphodiesterase n=1 Tax=Trichlorobacter ammonificans TaxID=2916410 RepID=A0ABM9D9R3_9BACT|nr:EAL domain-containing protein [Trichlorobacter ammonificans]CAH2031326.1 putative Cyclic-guanylate-specific phosphodiesterase [Trichlorobacter ammonificans]
MTPDTSAVLHHAHLEAIFHPIATGVIWFNRQGAITSFNRATLDIFGYDAEELAKMNVAALLSMGDPAEPEASFDSLISFDDGMSSHRVRDLVGRRKDGGIYHLDLLVSEFRLGDTSLFMGIMHDTSELKMSERELGLASKVFENMSEAVVVTDADNNYLSVNPAFSRITGYTQEEVIGKNPRIMSSGRHDAEFYRQMWEAIRTNGYWQGEIWNRRKNSEIYPKWLSIVAVRDAGDQVQNYIAVSSDISERKAADERIHFMAHYDALTGLPNRILLHDRLLQAILYAKRQQTKVAILFLDLDRFKTINDTLGHSVGDLLLQAVAERLKTCVRNSDTIARLGGDEFIVVIPDLRDADHAGKIAQKILNSIAAHFMIRDMELHTTASIGISLFPEDGTANEELISNADVAMYRAKDNGKNNYQFFTPVMNTSSYERLTIENKLRRALEREEFILYYQPQVNVVTGRIIGAEALVRWQNPEIGLVPPDMFISLAEENGMIVPIGEWVLREACRQNSLWQRQGGTPISVAVNLSAMQFHQKNLTTLVARVLEETELQPCWLELEITETGIMKNAEAITTLNALKQMGIKLSIDDFGTGYSSLSHLKKFPLDKLKIDKSFVHDVTTNQDDTAIVSAIIGMARSLNLQVIAEGVETREQRDFLAANGCCEMQGYLFSKPVPAREFEHFVTTGEYRHP